MEGPRSPGAHGLGKLFPKAIKQKRRRKKASISEAGTNSSNDDATPPRDRKPSRRERTGSTGTRNSHSAGHDGAISLQFYKSNVEFKAFSTRSGALSTCPSQIGTLTEISPVVQASYEPQAADSHPPKPPDNESAYTVSAPLTPDVNAFKEVRRCVSSGRLRDVFRRKSFSGVIPSTSSGSPENSSPAPCIPSLPTIAARHIPSPSVNPYETDNARLESSRGRQTLSRPQPPGSPKPPPTPPSADGTLTPLIVNTPPTPTESVHSLRSMLAEGKASSSNASPPSNMKSQRRGRAVSASLVPSKLSNTTSASSGAIQCAEEAPTSVPQGSQASNFFTSMISAAQNAATSIGGSITSNNLTPGGSKSASKAKLATPKEQPERENDTVEVESSAEARSERSLESKEPAVKTLGMGDLSLSHLGISEAESENTTPVTAKFFDSNNNDSRGRSQSMPPDANLHGTETNSEDSQQPLSSHEPGPNGERTPPPGSVYEGRSSVARSSSLRSAIGRRRKRGSSAATGPGTPSTIAAAIAAANASLAQPAAQSSAPKLTGSGFAYATKKRNRDFHTLFKSVPDEDYLIDDYSCALQREILAHGRLYVSEGHLCFSSNIFGWVTTLVMSFDEIVSVEKRSTALVFKNGLEICTLHAKHIFASFTSRDTTYDLIVKIWKLGHPGIKSSLNGVRLEGTGGDKTERGEAESMSVGAEDHSESGSDDESDEDDDDVYDEDEENEDVPDATQSAEATSADPADKGVGAANGAADKPGQKGAAPSGGVFPGPATHPPTECGDADSHYDKIVGDDIIPAPLGKVYDLMFGPKSPEWMKKWITGDYKCSDLTMDDRKGLVEDNRTRNYTYMLPSTASLGPRLIKCVTTEQLEALDLEKAVIVSCNTLNPDVPSGNVFSVKTKYCLAWAENNMTRIQATYTIDWTGKSWIKGPIEKSATEGQQRYCRELFASLKAAVSSHAKPAAAATGGGQKIRGKKGRKGKSTQASSPTGDVESVLKAPAKEDWGLFETVRHLVSPLVDIIRPLLNGNVLNGLLVGVLVATWFGFGLNRQVGRPYGKNSGHLDYPQRLAAYEEMWRREETELWDWLEERVGMDRLGRDGTRARRKAAEPKTVEERIRDERMDERELREAIKVTEERLETLKAVVEKVAGKGGEGAAV